MVGRTKTPTKEQKQRMGTLKEHVPCIACLLATKRVRMPEIHHLVSGMRREGHDSTISLCEFHHRGMLPDGKNKQEVSGMLGPSLAWGKRSFQQFFGPERLLLKITDFLLDEFHNYPWERHNVPFDLRRRICQYWIERK